MEYQHNGNAAELLLGSYQKDREPFIVDTTINFPHRDNGFEEIKKLKELFFPNYWNAGLITRNELELKKKINELGQLLFDGIGPYIPEAAKISLIVDNVLGQLANIREKLKKDVEAAYAGDPAAKSYAEIIRAYPGFSAIEIQRVAHLLYNLGVPSYPRELTEYIHSKTGIDIHPGAKIGECFFIDHGTGVVIGETAEIGNWVRIYQDVTLGVLHFEKDGGEVLKKGYKRHPTIGNHVVIGAGSKLLGPITVGDHVNIGANSWIQEDIPPYTTVFVVEHPRLERMPKNKQRGDK